MRRSWAVNPAGETVSGSQTSLDLLEQLVRIEQIGADTAVKRQILTRGPRQVFIGYATAVTALGAAVFTGLRLLAGLVPF